MDITKGIKGHNIFKKKLRNSNVFNSWFKQGFHIHLITRKRSDRQTLKKMRCVPLARVGGETAVPYFPGKGGAVEHRAAGGTAFRRLKDQARVSGALTPHFPCQGYNTLIVAQMF